MDKQAKAILRVNGRQYLADILVFDKDGLMFDSEQFWIEISNERMRALAAYCSVGEVLDWSKMMGIRTEMRGDFPEAVWVDPMGILAVASPTEEIIVTGGFLVERKELTWPAARGQAREVFEEADRKLDLTRALRPQPGFLSLMRRLAELDIPYGLATSDMLERARASLSLFGCWEKVRFTVTPDDVPRNKPEPDMLLYIAEKQQVPPERIVMIGDSYVDVKMAHAAGSIGLGVTPDPEMQRKMEGFATEIIPSLELISVERG